MDLVILDDGYTSAELGKYASDADDPADVPREARTWNLTVNASALSCFGMRATIVGTDANNILQGTPGNDVIAGLGGNDIINGRVAALGDSTISFRSGRHLWERCLHRDLRRSLVAM